MVFCLKENKTKLCTYWMTYTTSVFQKLFRDRAVTPDLGMQVKRRVKGRTNRIEHREVNTSEAGVCSRNAEGARDSTPGWRNYSIFMVEMPSEGSPWKSI